ncbi:hypothetical protein Tco_0840947 [Tanacetum coccineum]|uniref:Uncharacterized protein n=1 Tax=Tanacetum coccineum TaxID=301880 RepID=A0ABQ5AUZ9_9ASTR
MVVQNQSQLGEGSDISTDPRHTPTFIQPSTQPQKTQQPRKPKRKDTQVPRPNDPIESVVDEVVYKELGDSLVRAATTASSLEAEQDSGGGPRCQETMGDTIAQTRFESVSKHSNDSLLARDGEEVFVAEQEVVVKDVNNKVNVVEEVVEVINSAKLITDAAQVSAAGNVVSTASDATTVSAATTTTATITTVDDITLAQALMEIKSTKPKEKGVVIQELEQQQEELSIEENATLFQQLLEKRRKHFAAKRAEEKRNKPPTKAQQRKIMCTYLKNMEGYKLKDLKLKEFDSIQEMFDRAFKRVNTFKDFRTELVEGKEKRAGTELIQENAKKQKVEDNKEIAELKQCLEIILVEEEVIIDAIPLAVKSPSIVGWKIYKEGRKSYYQIMRADGKSQMYMIFSQMLKSFDREDLEDLYKLVKAKYESTRPVEDLDLLLWDDLKTMFEPHIEDEIYMLVEKKYPLAPLTLSMMLEKKLIIDYESEMAYQLLKFIIK